MAVVADRFSKATMRLARAVSQIRIRQEDAERLRLNSGIEARREAATTRLESLADELEAVVREL